MMLYQAIGRRYKLGRPVSCSWRIDGRLLICAAERSLGHGSYPSIRYLSKKWRVPERSLYYHLRGRDTGTHIYQPLYPWAEHEITPETLGYWMRRMLFQSAIISFLAPRNFERLYFDSIHLADLIISQPLEMGLLSQDPPSSSQRKFIVHVEAKFYLFLNCHLNGGNDHPDPISLFD